MTVPGRSFRAASLALWLSLALAAACGGGREAAPAGTGTAAPAATTAPVVPSPATGSSAATPASAFPNGGPPEAARAMAHLKVLAGDIGVRAATTEGERRAADYIRGQLEAAGYRASLEAFDVDAVVGGSATLRPEGADDVTVQPMSGSPDATARGPLVAAGLGRTSDYAGVPARGGVVLVDRGEIQFAEKARNAQQAGAAALVIVNNVPGAFRGELGRDATTIPVLSAAQEDRAALLALSAAARAVTVTTKTERVQGTSQNVVGRPSDRPCTAYMGAHYDSVPAGPGANDNASGTSLLLELARARRVEGVCVIAFGSEEIGLFGSRAYLREHGSAGVRFMLNFDMVAKTTRPEVIGDPDLADRAARLGSARGFTVGKATSIGPNASSDHAPFLSAGVPALMFYAGNDPFIHTAQDDVANTSEADLARFLDLAVALLDDLTAR